ncbi:MAG TPA: VWA domain-containing protein [Anaerolineales bacterium]|nr:VWA domain-containing protein [Anaerolineales bacterium]
MTFAKPTFLYLLALVPLFAVFLVWANNRRKADISRLGDRTLIDRLSAGINWQGRRWRSVLWLLALALIIVSLARPQWGTEVQTVEQEGLQVMVALDVSQSMLAEDIKPNRLERAKLEISDLMDRLNGDEVGLVLFSGASFIQFPLTSDYNTARMYLDGANPNVISRPGTAIGEAIRTAVSGFDESLDSQKVLIVISDGEDRETDPLAAAQEAADQGILIYVIGFGTPEGEPVPETDPSGNVTGYKRDQQGEVVISRLDENTLQQIAQIGGGQYFRAGADAGELDKLLAEISTLQKAKLESRFNTRMIERYQGFLLVALLALIFAELIPDRVKVKTPKNKEQRLAAGQSPVVNQ